VIREVTADLDKFEFGVAVQKIYDFIWDEFCDWYIEISKPALFDTERGNRKEVQYVLNRILMNSLKLLHPFMPFITEEIFMNLVHDEKSIMISEWPVYDPADSCPEDEKDMRFLMDSVRAIRNLRSELKVPHTRSAKAMFMSSDERSRRMFMDSEPLLKRLASVSEAQLVSDDFVPQANTLTAIIETGKIYIPLGELIDIGEEIGRLGKEMERFGSELKRAQEKLANPSFIQKAPKELIDKEMEKAARYAKMAEETEARIKSLE
jgi:valyl-tRNA synthetase